MNQKYAELPQPEDIPQKERDDAMGAYLMMFASTGLGLPLPIINLIASIVYYFINKKNSRFVHFHSLQSLLSQLPVSLLNGLVIVWGIRLLINDTPVDDTFLGFVGMAVVANLIYLVFSIIAAVKANKGRMYYFLLFGRYSYSVAFTLREEKPKAIVNRPPSM